MDFLFMPLKIVRYSRATDVYEHFSSTQNIEFHTFNFKQWI